MKGTTSIRRMSAVGLNLLAVLCLSHTAQAQPVTGQVIDRVVVSRSTGCYDIRIGLTFPMQYVGHFPAEQGDLLRIRLKPAVTESLPPDILSLRESARPNVVHGSPLVDVTYEGDADEPQLIVQFTHVVAYSLIQGDDFRSLLLQVHPPEADTGPGCQSVSDPDE
ncbi:MAG: hypothetical protein IPK65_11110 [Gammaproteobacteria bacterium]|nr:hypothetical protein [Gammaproteobacteria bacterium]